MTAKGMGALRAVGRTSEVFDYGSDSVVKVLGAHIPPNWAAVEVRLTDAARQLGIAAPEVRDVITVGGCPAIVFERIDGPSMWDAMCSAPERGAELMAQFVEVQRGIQAAGVPDGVWSLVERMRSKIDEVVELDPSDRREAASTIVAMPAGAALLHGDFHPANILLGPRGPVVVDWFDASIGHPMADVVRTSVLLRSTSTGVGHLPGSTPALLDHLHDRYLIEMRDVLVHSLDDVRRWEAVVAASRLAEGADSDPAGLREIWDGRDDPAASRLLRLVSAVV